jgi:hypothetical protein
LTVVSVAFLFGTGALVGSLAGRKLAQQSMPPRPRVERRAPERLVRDLERCVELGDCVTRDADTLSSLVTIQASAVPREVAAAVSQLIKTTKNLAGRLQRMADVGGVARAGCTGRASGAAAASAAPANVGDATSDAAENAPQAAGAKAPATGELQDARRFPRSQFRGSAKATIYPSSTSHSTVPIQCTVLTRNLSCGGVGIAYSERLYPQQIIVLEAVGKVLVGEIRWCRQVEDNFFIAGCRLVKASD